MNEQILAQVLCDQLLDETRRRLFEEGIPRIQKCLSQLSEAEIWQRPNDQLVSIGNLVLHLCGNVRQWVIHGIGGAPDVRDRDREFATSGPLPTEDLLTLLARLQEDLKPVLAEITPETLTNAYRIQGFDENGLSILVHVVEHFSYHVGQITWYTKHLKNMDMGYYAGHDLNI